MGMDRRYSEREYQIITGEPLPPARLAQIWSTLPEKERFSFVLSLEESLADSVIAAAVKYAAKSHKEPNQC